MRREPLFSDAQITRPAPGQLGGVTRTGLDVHARAAMKRQARAGGPVLQGAVRVPGPPSASTLAAAMRAVPVR